MTPEEKAKKLGVPIIPPSIIPPFKRTPNKLKGSVYEPPVTAVCGGCGKSIYASHREEPCGRENCPFGVLVM